MGRNWTGMGGGFRVRGCLGKGLSAQAGSRSRVNTLPTPPTPRPKVVSDLFLPLAITLGTHRQFPSPDRAADPGPRRMASRTQLVAKQGSSEKDLKYLLRLSLTPEPLN